MAAGQPERRLVRLGKVVGIWGVGGWIKVHSFTGNRAGIFDYGRWTLDTGSGRRTYELESGRRQGRGLVAKLRGLDDRDAAAAAVGAWIDVDVADLPVLDAGEYFWHQLEGLKVETLEGVPLGSVEYLFETGANDVLVVQGERERWLPYTAGVVQGVDLEAGIMRVDWDPDF